jgi:hypothetical protein
MEILNYNNINNYTLIHVIVLELALELQVTHLYRTEFYSYR